VSAGLESEETILEELMKKESAEKIDIIDAIIKYRHFKKIKDFIENLLNSRKGSRMFSLVTETWNPVTGCNHYCIYCWARRLALTKLKNTKKYRNGFKPAIHPNEFKKKFSGGIVFVTDMGDLFSSTVPREWILKVIRYTAKFSDTYFLFMTKNPMRYHEFLDEFPPNAILGATIETDRDDLYYKHKISQAPPPSERYIAMKTLDWDKKFISIEPILDFDLENFSKWIEEISPIMVYIGYDNYGWKLPEPPLNKTLELIDKLREITIVIKKTIRKAWNE